MKLHEDSYKITAFSTPHGLFQWKVLPMGMKTSGAVFQQIMDDMLGELQPQCAVAYIDDITVFSPNMATHFKDVEDVLASLNRVNLKVNIAKCKFAMAEVKVLGHIVYGSGIMPNPEKVKVIQNFEPPTTLTGVKSFLGVINFYRKFIPNCSTLAEPLIKLTRGRSKSQNITWTEDQQLSFTILKNKLTEPPILRLPDFSKEFIIETDASSVGIGAMLSQKHVVDSEGINLPVAYASRSLSKAERNYGTTDLEGLAVIWAIQHFESYIHGMHFTIVTDHSALKALKDKSKLTGRLL